MKKTLLTLAACLAASALWAQPEKPKVYMVSNAHFDSQWNWDVQKSINEYVRNTITQNLYLLDKYPDYVFNFEGGIKYRWMQEYFPEEFERVREYIKNGRWHISGASWDANDPNMPSPESFFRNILLGQEFYKKEFEVKSTDIFLPDCFGFAYTLPTVAAHSGLIGFSTQKLQWRHKPFHGDSKVPFEVGLWEGVDGSRIMAAANAGNYTEKLEKNGDEKLGEMLAGIADKSPNKKGYRYYGVGDIGGSPTVLSVEAIERGVAGKFPVGVVSATSDQLFKEYLPFDKHPELPVYKGELLMDVHATGCYTSQAAMKHYNRRNEQLAFAGEGSASVADWFGGYRYPQEQLTEAWKRFIWHQFHDDLTGTSIPKAYTFSWNDELISQGDFNDIVRSATASVASALDTRAKGTPVVVYNPLAQSRRELVEIDLPVAEDMSGVAVYGPDGKKAKSQLVGMDGKVAKIRFSADLEPMSFSVYDVRKAGKSAAKSALKASDRTLENAVYKLTLDDNGDIRSLVDKRNGRELVKAGETIGLVMFDENKSYAWPAWEVLKATIDREPKKVTGDVRISIAEKSGNRVALKVEKSWGDSRFEQVISLTEGGADDRIDFDTRADWKTTDALLKARFPLSVSNPDATYDLGIGSVQRGNNTETAYEVCAQQWADLTEKDGSYGVAVINDCKYGWDKPDDNTLRLTLLHTPSTDKGYAYQNRQDWGQHRMKYSIVAHKGDYHAGEVPAKAEAMNNPVFAFAAPQHSGALGKEFSAVKSDDMMLKLFKKAESGEGYIVRLYENSGKGVRNGVVEFALPIVEAWETNGIEEKTGKAAFEGKKLMVSAGAFAPKTYLVRFADPAVKVQKPVNTIVTLPYNMQAYSNDAFLGQVDIDRKGNSYADELVPEVIFSQGVEFRRGEFGRDNAVRCDGQTLSLGDIAPSGTLYLLAASIKGDKTCAFKVGDKQVDAKVGDYMEFYGQWNYEGRDGYVKDIPLAHVSTHTHNKALGNRAYDFTYMYRIALPLDGNAKSVTLPQDKDIVIFAATVSDTPADRILPLSEYRVIP